MALDNQLKRSSCQSPRVSHHAYKYLTNQAFITFSGLSSLIQKGQVDLVVNLPNKYTKYVKDNYLIRRAAVDYGCSLITNLQVSLQLYQNSKTETISDLFSSCHI